MKTKARILAGAAIATLLGAMALTTAESRASVPSSPAERAATAELNRDVMRRNAAADEQHTMQEAQYQQQQRQYEAQRQEYQDRLQSSQDDRGR
jgi:hypothetical protein